MTYHELVRPEVLTQPVYEPGKPITDVAREHALQLEAIHKLASNENPLGPSPMGLKAAHEALAEAHRYPDGGATALKQALAAHLQLDPTQLLLGNGSNELMVLLTQAFMSPADEAVLGAHAFIAFKLAVLLAGAHPVEVPMPGLKQDLAAMLRAITPKTRFVYLPNPNNPTGDFICEAEVLAFARDLPEHVILCYDEAYAEYVEAAPDLRPLIAEGRKVICLRTFSKAYGLAALRVGYAYMSAEAAELVNRLRQPFNVNSIAQAAALAALSDPSFVQRCKLANQHGLMQLQTGLEALGLQSVPSHGNFLLMEAARPAELFLQLQRRGVIVRPVGGYGLPHHVRLSVGTEAENAALLDALKSILHSEQASMLLPITKHTDGI
jgi:histidinol-phosphate aminotransferase